MNLSSIQSLGSLENEEAMSPVADMRQRLVAAGGEHPERRAHAEAELNSAEIMPGFASTLVVAMNSDVF